MKPKIYAIMPKDASGEDLTLGNKYKISNPIKKGSEIVGFNIIDDSGFELLCCTEKCAHLNGLNWILIEEA